MTILRTLAAVALLSPTLVWADTEFGYANGKIDRNYLFRIGDDTRQGLAIRLSHEKLQALKGQTINGVMTAFGSVNQVANKAATLFVTTALDDSPLQTQTCTVSRSGVWLTYPLDTPYVITGEEEQLYIGFSLETLGNTTSAFYTDQAEELRGCCYALNNGKWTDLYTVGKGNAELKITLAGDVKLTDVMIKEIDLSEIYHKAEQEYHYQCGLFNFGTEVVSECEVAIRLNGQESLLHYDNLTLGQMQGMTIDLPVLCSQEVGDVDIDASIVSVNGSRTADAAIADNAFQTTSFFYPVTMERNLLTEEFTGTGCVNCPAGKRVLEASIQESGIPCVEIMHHSGYNPDIYSMDADWEYTVFFGSANTFAPAVMVNRIVNPQLAAVPTLGKNGMTKSELISTLEMASQRQPYVSLELESRFDEQTREVEVSFAARCHNDMPGMPLFNIYLVQDSIMGYQNNGGGLYAHNGVLRRLVVDGSIWGMLFPSDFGRDKVVTWSTKFTLPEAIYSDFWTEETLQSAGYTAEQVTQPTRPKHMRLVAYVGNYNQTNFNDHLIYNSIEVPLVNGYCKQGAFDAPSALEAVTEARQPESRGIYDLSGRKMAEGAVLPAGLYIVNGKKTMICDR